MTRSVAVPLIGKYLDDFCGELQKDKDPFAEFIQERRSWVMTDILNCLDDEPDITTRDDLCVLLGGFVMGMSLTFSALNQTDAPTVS